jgi:hypothetical protein
MGLASVFFPILFNAMMADMNKVREENTWQENINIFWEYQLRENRWVEIYYKECERKWIWTKRGFQGIYIYIYTNKLMSQSSRWGVSAYAMLLQ